ncbi:MAG: hypothetical protein WDO68_02550 [Gammaproteobacteria bacterium]
MKRAQRVINSSMASPRTAGRRLMRAIAIVGCVSGLAACGGDHDAPATPPPPPAPTTLSQLQADVASGVLPTLDLTASVTGTDTNGNGIRDDIEALIAKQSDLPLQRAALTQVAHSIQATLSLDPGNAGASATAAADMRKAIACLFVQYDASVASGRFHWIQEVSINTLTRLQAYDRFNISMNNSATPMATGAVCNAV